MLIHLLERGLELHPGVTSQWFFTDDKKAAPLVWPKVKQTRGTWRNGLKASAWNKVPPHVWKVTGVTGAGGKSAAERNEREARRSCEASLGKLAVRKRARGLPEEIETLPALGIPACKTYQARVEARAQDPAQTLGRFDAPGRGTQRPMKC